AGGVEPNERAAKDWLANLDRPWLLLIDNADDLTMPLDNFFPEGDRGTILVTSRNPLNRMYGTIGEGSYHFERLGEAEANVLLLRAACEPLPWSDTARGYAAKISERLGFLALAVLQAGKAIAKRMATLGNYLDVYDRSWQKIRRLRKKHSAKGSKDLTVNMNVYSSYEIIFRGLEATDSVTTQDAVQLIKMFSFLSWENLRIDVLTTSVEHPRRQLQHDREEAAKSTDKPSITSNRWRQRVKDLVIWAVMTLQADRTGPLLPEATYAETNADFIDTVLRDEHHDFDEDRLLDALDQLNQLSLIYYQEATESYSMHPLIHTWVRERPQMSTGEQALWCQAAATTLSQSILLPPLDSLDSAVALQRHLLPHISRVLEYQKKIDNILAENRESRRKIWPALTSTFGRLQAMESAKFSLIYLQNGYFSEAEILQMKTRDFVCSRLGMDHVAARRISLFLAVTYGLQMRNNKAAVLQEEVLEACKIHLGPRDPETLKVVSKLAASRRFQGRFKESRELFEEAIEGMTAVLGPEHEDTLTAIDNLGQLKWMEHHMKAVEGMSKLNEVGPLHEKTLVAKDNLAMACLSFEGTMLVDEPSALNLMTEVLHERRKRLGKEHPWTLYAILNLARVKSGLGDHLEAEGLIRTALPIARRNLGDNHFGTLAATTHLAQILVRQSRFDEAEDMFTDVVQRQRYEASARDDGEHPDRIGALWFLTLCYQAHGNVDDALRVCKELIEAVSTIGGQGLGLLHPFAKKLHQRCEELESLKAQNAEACSSMELVPA
ncbi:MAG: hypothetical protein Q9180_005546, partial [Flavoplaca navasiana]